jgi:site-specific DNA recombinase
VEATTRAKRELLTRGILPQGTGKGLYGYKWDKTQKRRIPDEYEAEIVKRIFTLIADRVSRFSIAKMFNEQGIPSKLGGKWEARTINRIAMNSAYIGLTYFGKTSGSRKTQIKVQDSKDWTLLPDATPPIIDKELFKRVQKHLGRIKELRPGKPLYDYLLTGHIRCGYCGSPPIGACLGRKYLYYRCRGTCPTASRGQICNAKYIKADFVENATWEKVKEVLENHQLILSELNRQMHTQNQTSYSVSLDKKISKLRRHLSNYDYQEKRLIRLFRYEEIAEDYVLDELNRLKSERQSDKEQLVDYIRIRDEMNRLANTEIKLNEFCERVRQNLAQCTLEDKRLALDALDVKVIATREHIEISGVVPITQISKKQPEVLLTTGQTLGCLIVLYYNNLNDKESVSIVPG